MSRSQSCSHCCLGSGFIAQWLLFSGALSPFGLSKLSAEEPVTPRYLIYPVTTELQRRLTPAQTNIFVLLDATSFFKDDKIAIEAIRLKDLRDELAKHKRPNTNLHFTFFFNKSDQDQSPQQDLLRYAMLGLGHELGFPKVTAGQHYQNDDRTWADLVAEVAMKNPRQPKGEESASGNEIVKVYPVGTELSRYLTSGADCVVEVVPLLVNEQGTVPKQVQETAAEFVAKLKLTSKKKVSFQLRHIEVSVEEREHLLKEFKRLAESLGFEASVVAFR